MMASRRRQLLRRCETWSSVVAISSLLVLCCSSQSKADEVGLPGSCGVVVTTRGTPATASGVLVAEPHQATTFVIRPACSDGGPSPGLLFRTRRVAAGSRAATSPATTAPLGGKWRPAASSSGGAHPAEQPSEVHFGTEVNIMFAELGPAKLEVASCPADVASADAAAGTGWCRAPLGPQVHVVPVAVTYVRREIRSLSAAQRQRYFRAVHEMAAVPTEAGRSRYGPMFYNYYELAARHAAAVQTACDLAHFGPAFVTFHRAFVREFEASLQAIDPALAAPYWDYQADALLPDPTTSAIFSDEYFGSFVGDPDDDYVVKDGQFANWKVPSGPEAEHWGAKMWGRLGPSGMVSRFGFFRRPDSMNPARSLSRLPGTADSWPRLAAWERCRNMTVLGLYIPCLATTGTHPVVHSLIGGTIEDPEFRRLRERLDCQRARDSAACSGMLDSLAGFSTVARSNAVLDGCVRCGRRCGAGGGGGRGGDEAECACTCLTGEERCDPRNVLTRTLGKMNAATGKWPPGVREALGLARYGVCANRTLMGDYNDLAASVVDPIFFLHHANLDRLLATWRRAHPRTPWAATGFTYPSPDADRYPDYLSATNVMSGPAQHPGVFPPGDGNPSGFCEGHGLREEIGRGMFRGLFRSRPLERPLTNLDVLETIDVELADPAGAEYIYDHYP